MSDQPLLNVFLKNELYVDQITNNITLRQDFIYGSDIINDHILPASIRETLVDQKYSYFFDIVHKHAQYTEICTFAMTVDVNQSNNFILNNMDILKLIAEDLSRRCRRLLTRDNTIILPNHFIIEMNMLAELKQPEAPVSLKDLILGKKNKTLKLHELSSDTPFDFNKLPFNFLSARELTLKEKEIIYLYYYGFSLPRIASILEISKRTVDKHVENIKKKLGCESTGQIIPLLLRNNISIKDFTTKG
jgi:DNA-binding CsgD family transcriptional regulator